MKRTKQLIISLLTLLCCSTGVWAEGELKGLFTINDNGDKVQFSQGNLQATYDGSDWSWAFAKNQWDYIGNAAANTSINGNGSASTNGTVDLFNLSTSATTYGIHNSTSYETYSGDFVDWGNNMGDGWRTLASNEWKYIFMKRSSGSQVFGASNSRYTHATINTDGTPVNGIILFPDGVTIARSEVTSWGSVNGNSEWGTKCTSAQWKALEAKGCVFLPAAGYRYGASVSYTGDNGYYLSSDTWEDSGECPVCFRSNYLSSTSSTMRHLGCSVRLVKDRQLNKDADGYYLLGTVDDWRYFAAHVAAVYSGAKARMTADIDLGDDQTTIGSGNTNAAKENFMFRGVFDGNGHTLTVNYNTSEGFYAPFRHIYGATIKNLHVTGSIISSGGRVGGIVCGVFGGSSTQSKIEKCRSSVVITSNCQLSNNDAESVGGIVGQVGFSSRLSIEDCIFDGEITGHVSNVIWSGLVGVLDGTVNTTRCLQAGSFNDLDNGTTSNSATIVCRWQNAATSIVTMDETYYIHPFKTVQGTQATTAQLADGTITTALNAGRTGDEAVWVQQGDQPMLKIFASEQEPEDEDYYLLSTAQDMRDFATLVNGGNNTAKAKVMNDIDLQCSNDNPWTPIGTSDNPYKGTFDGQGYTVSGLSGNYGLFDMNAAEGKIMRVIVDGNIYSGNGTGGIVSSNSGTVTQCGFIGTIGGGGGTNNGHVAGIASYNNGQISHCFNRGSISARYVGGIAGICSSSGSVQNCYNAGQLTMDYIKTSSAIVGDRWGAVSNCYTLEGSASHHGSDGSAGTVMSAEDFARGKVCYLLQQAVSDGMIWGQYLGDDAYPVLSSDPALHVAYNPDDDSYSNSVVDLTPYVIWCNGNKTLYFDNIDTELTVGDIYDGQTVTTVWSGADIIRSVARLAPAWKICGSAATRVVFKEGFSSLHPRTLYCWFYNFSQLQEIVGIENLNTSQAINMEYMFYSCKSMQSIDVSGFNTSQVTNMYGMFSDCESLQSIDASGFNTSQVTNMAYMFYNCESMQSVDVSGFNTSQVTKMSYMFSRCHSLQSIDVSGFDTQNVTTMEAMFSSCRSLQSIDVRGFDTQKVTKMGHMFGGCENLKSLDLSNFDTRNVKDMSYMFAYSTRLKTIYIGDLWYVYYGGDMFTDCTSLVGGDGTLYDENYIDKTKAYAGDGGYLTYSPAYMVGDANGNGEVEIGDVTSVLTLMATPEANGYNNKAADANGNGEIEIGDVTTILTIMAGGGK